MRDVELMHRQDEANRETSMSATLRWFAKSDSGATAIEYGLIAGLIALAIIFSVQTAGESLYASFNSTADNIAKASK